MANITIVSVVTKWGFLIKVQLLSIFLRQFSLKGGYTSYSKSNVKFVT